MEKPLVLQFPNHDQGDTRWRGGGELRLQSVKRLLRLSTRTRGCPGGSAERPNDDRACNFCSW